MKKFINGVILSLTAFAVFGILVLIPGPAAQADNAAFLAVNIQEEFRGALESAKLVKTGEQPTSPEEAVGKMINTILTYVGVLTLVMIIYAGGLWATARGNEKTIEKSKKILVGGIIGLAIIFSAAAMVNFVISRLGTALL